MLHFWGFPVCSVVKNPPANAGDTGDASSISNSERSPGEGNGNPLQYSFLENPMDRGARGYHLQGPKESDTTLKTYNAHMGSLDVACGI